MFLVKFARQSVMGKRGSFDQKESSFLVANVPLNVLEDLTADSSSMRISLNCDPIQIPSPIGHGGRRIVGEADYLAGLFVGNAAVADLFLVRMIIIENFSEGLNLQRFKNGCALGQGHQAGRVFGNRGTNHR